MRKPERSSRRTHHCGRLCIIIGVSKYAVLFELVAVSDQCTENSAVTKAPSTDSEQSRAVQLCEGARQLVKVLQLGSDDRSRSCSLSIVKPQTWISLNQPLRRWWHWTSCSRCLCAHSPASYKVMTTTGTYSLHVKFFTASGVSDINYTPLKHRSPIIRLSKEKLYMVLQEVVLPDFAPFVSAPLAAMALSCMLLVARYRTVDESLGFVLNVSEFGRMEHFLVLEVLELMFRTVACPGGCNTLHGPQSPEIELYPVLLDLALCWIHPSVLLNEPQAEQAHVEGPCYRRWIGPIVPLLLARGAPAVRTSESKLELTRVTPIIDT